MSSVSNPSFGDLAREASLQPQEKLVRVSDAMNSLSIGIPKEITYQENRVPLSPMAVQLLVDQGHSIQLESGCGEKANFSDLDYSSAGGEILVDKESIFKNDIILKVAPPTDDEIGYMKPNQILISALQMVRTKESMVKQLISKNITAIGYELIRDDEGALPIMRCMSEIAGRSSVLIAAEYLSNFNAGKGELFGGIPGVQPTKVVIIGAGAVGEYAAQAAIGLGASVKLFDNNINKLRRIEKNLGSRISSSTIIPKTLAKAISECDVAIGALRSPLGYSPCVVTEEMVTQMRDQAIIIDVSIDQGGCFETSNPTDHQNPVFEKHNVLHYCVPNIPSRYSRTASYALSNIFTHLLSSISSDGGFETYLKYHEGLRAGVYLYKGKLTNKLIANRFNLPSSEIEFLLAGI
ncbi:MAG: Alanine dehydrogenase 2 [Bacteroidia bacterium]|nr:MAG: Alanine dehydrogenase 2 [Bacteroidia bacterium]